jgi:hypothetical protein
MNKLQYILTGLHSIANDSLRRAGAEDYQRAQVVAAELDAQAQAKGLGDAMGILLGATRVLQRTLDELRKGPPS